MVGGGAVLVERGPGLVSRGRLLRLLPQQGGRAGSSHLSESNPQDMKSSFSFGDRIVNFQISTVLPTIMSLGLSTQTYYRTDTNMQF